HASVVFDNKMWILGGAADQTGCNDVWYSTDGANWSQATAAAGWSKRFSHSALVFDNKMWVIGGFASVDGNDCNDVWYSTDGANWYQATAAAGWAPRDFFGATVFDDKMWIFGGEDTLNYFNDVWYSSDGANWTQATGTVGWAAKAAHTALSFDNKMWVIGGANNSASYSDVWYSTGTGVEEKSNIKNQISKIETYPNPFVEKTVISYSGNKSTNNPPQAEITIYDITGKLVEEPKDNIIGKTLKSGIYFVKVAGYKPIKITKMGEIK
ncbi:MAG: T9SS type A sorting domain-containing protein, partial [bacterium]|nr:T9SS type A sorting domain-containing protein [bacterium]